MVYSTIQEIRNTSTEVYYLLATESFTVGDLLERSGTGHTDINFTMPTAKKYATAGGTNPCIGVCGVTRGKVLSSGDDLYQVGATYERVREIAPITQCDALLPNTGCAVVAFDRIAPAVGGFQKAESGMYDIGYALEDIAAGGTGLVRIDIDNQRTV